MRPVPAASRRPVGRRAGAAVPDDYARRNPEARAKLARSASREREFVQQLIEDEYAARGISPPHPTRDLAEISMALFAGLSSRRLVDPQSVSEQTLDTVLLAAQGSASATSQATALRLGRANESGSATS